MFVLCLYLVVTVLRERLHCQWSVITRKSKTNQTFFFGYMRDMYSSAKGRSKHLLCIHGLRP